jgi:hypothetical protein
MRSGIYREQLYELAKISRELDYEKLAKEMT